MNSLLEVAKLIQTCGDIEGRVKLQKMVYILQQAGYRSFNEDFGYLHHGPYSSDLKREIDQLIEWNLVRESEEPVIQYNQYRYSPSDHLADVLIKVGTHTESEWTDMARTLNKKSSAELEAIATIMFLRRHDFRDDRLRERFEQLKPHLKARFDDGLNEAEKYESSRSEDDPLQPTQ